MHHVTYDVMAIAHQPTLRLTMIAVMDVRVFRSMWLDWDQSLIFGGLIN